MPDTAAVVDPGMIRELVRPLDPCVSVYLGLQQPEPTGDSTADLALRWRGSAATLAAAGADQATIDAVGARIARQPLGPLGYAVLASAGAVRYARSLPGGPLADRVSFGAPAAVAHLLAWLDQHPAYVVVSIDRTGADVNAVGRGAVAGRTTVVAGPDDEIERNAPGGWSQPRYQRRAEDSWQHNAVAVANAVADAVHRVSARLLLVGGDVRAVQLLRDHLAKSIRHAVSVRQLPGGRSADGSGALRQAAIASAVEAFVTDETDALLDRLADERRPDGLAVDGPATTLNALAEGRVRMLLVADDPGDDRIAWFGPDLLCAEREQPAAIGGWQATGRLVDVAIRAALLTDAEVRVFDGAPPAALAGGIAALCRYAPVQPSPATS